jgi:hypothetical protein
MFVFTKEVMSNKGIRRYIMGKIHNDRYEGTSRCYKPVYQWITVRGSVGVNRSYGGISPEVRGYPPI